MTPTTARGVTARKRTRAAAMGSLAVLGASALAAGMASPAMAAEPYFPDGVAVGSAYGVHKGTYLFGAGNVGQERLIFTVYYDAGQIEWSADDEHPGTPSFPSTDGSSSAQSVSAADTAR